MITSDVIDRKAAPAVTERTLAVCAVRELEPNIGVCVLLPDERQVAVFNVPDDAGTPRIYAVSNVDPYMNAAVLSRGLVGERDGIVTLASPLLKQLFSLADGHSLQDDGVVLETFAVSETRGTVYLHY